MCRGETIFSTLFIILLDSQYLRIRRSIRLGLALSGRMMTCPTESRFALREGLIEITLLFFHNMGSI